MTAPEGDRERLAEFLFRLRGEPHMSPALLKAVESVPRRLFVPAGIDDPYENRTAPIECGETMPGALAAVRLANWLEPQPEQRVLEIGTGSGYVTALLARIVGHVTTFDRYRRLLKSASQRFRELGISNVTAIFEDGREGFASGSPYHRIIIHSAFPAPPKQFLDQLGPHSALICAIGPGDGQQELVRLRKVGSRFEREDLGTVRYQAVAFGKADVL
ncbi:protein-L-isoaspartate(D-aspartate) O-methyltransferase [Jiella sp. MQZ9-1]|uniref:Protein-L-isoaspartate O-methyltransferase n=1 Tax=Jiella flava TaxID=2816857 RepID=A0A939FVL1_9HYPH|nr:protein-L-isoaspartate(D-aspartate) O-methyltransferase [Jiella flava]MBO0662768.1 protein-L-isoaspartate(D-aspartate) O-methyltransferase [Jiella flava]MCD2471190.1 protein-L-isoaspartate(D-aspartate) O-methyltransferase [Jiella flava]